MTKNEAPLTPEEVRDLIRNKISHKRLLSLGNTTRRLKDVAIDLIHASGQDWRDIADGTFLAPATVKNLATEKTRFPRIDTVERILNYYEFRLEAIQDPLKPAYRNKPKNK